jgi:hypothetical protein
MRIQTYFTLHFSWTLLHASRIICTLIYYTRRYMWTPLVSCACVYIAFQKKRSTPRYVTTSNGLHPGHTEQGSSIENFMCKTSMNAFLHTLFIAWMARGLGIGAECQDGFDQSYQWITLQTWMHWELIQYQCHNIHRKMQPYLFHKGLFYIKKIFVQDIFALIQGYDYFWSKNVCVKMIKKRKRKNVSRDK